MKYEDISLERMIDEKIDFDAYLSNKIIDGISVWVEYHGEDMDDSDQKTWMWLMWNCFKAIEMCKKHLGRFPTLKERLAVITDDRESYCVKYIDHEVTAQSFDDCEYSIRIGVVKER